MNNGISPLKAKATEKQLERIFALEMKVPAAVADYCRSLTWKTYRVHEDISKAHADHYVDLLLFHLRREGGKKK